MDTSGADRCGPKRPPSPTNVEALLRSTNGLSLSDFMIVDRYVEAELQTRQQKLEVQVRNFASFALVVREWREACVRGLQSA